QVYGPASVEALALSPDEKWLAVGYATGLVQVWDLSWLDLSREQAKARIEAWTGLTLKAGKLVPLDEL
ncbi:MAG TPA: WD40 repeat domain-containing protein, partial [Myxococcota bacterium]|nr:WD40 repeat domain-containing protein [Myxococcota bacterium]